MRKRDERLAGQGKHQAKPVPLYEKKATGQSAPDKPLRPQDFCFNDADNTATCPAAEQRNEPKHWHTPAVLSENEAYRQLATHGNQAGGGAR